MPKHRELHKGLDGAHDPPVWSRPASGGNVMEREFTPLSTRLYHPARCHDTPDVRAGHLLRDRARPTDAPNALGAHVGRFGAFGLVGQIARRTLRPPPQVLGAPAAPRRAVLGAKRGLERHERAPARARRARRCTGLAVAGASWSAVRAACSAASDTRGLTCRVAARGARAGRFFACACRGAAQSAEGARRRALRVENGWPGEGQRPSRAEAARAWANAH